MLYAWRGVGKTHVALGIAYATASGGSFTPSDRQEALTIALGDPVSALECFRALAARLPGRTAEGPP